jgi:hypothetical protein
MVKGSSRAALKVALMMETSGALMPACHPCVHGEPLRPHDMA